MIFILVSLIFYPGLALTVAHGEMIILLYEVALILPVNKLIVMVCVFIDKSVVFSCKVRILYRVYNRPTT